MPWKKTETGIVHFVSNRAGLWTEVVSQETNYTSSELLAWADFGGVYLNDSRIQGEHEIQDQSYLRIHTNPRRYPRIPLLDRIVFENQDLLIVRKPAGLPCHPTVDNLKENLWYDLEKQRGLPTFPTHRLDVPTSGLLVLTKNTESQSQFQEMLKNKEIKKTYQALVENPGPSLGLHEHFMEKSRYAPKTVHDTHRAHTQICLLEIIEKNPHPQGTQLTIQLITGRTHQIRAQLSFLGFPILGDRLYGLGEKDSDSPIALTCVELDFPWKKERIHCRIEPEFPSF